MGERPSPLRPVAGAGVSFGPGAEPIIAVRFAQREQAYALWTDLIERGVYVNLVVAAGHPGRQLALALQR